MEQFSSNNVEKTERTAQRVVDRGQSRNVFLLQLVQMRSEAQTPSGAVDIWRSNIGAKAAEVSSLYCVSHYCEELCSLA
jgi:hypothetical protein